jgi:hypothetical protein
MFAARYRVEVRDKEGKLVTVIEDDSKSFTQNFMNLLVASHYNQNNAPTLTVYDVLGNAYYTGYTASPNVGVPFQLFNIDYGCWGHFPNSDYWAVPAIWLGTSPCPNPVLANGPCGSLVACCIPVYKAAPYPFSPYNFSPNAACYGITSCSPPLTEEGWALTITNQWLNTSRSPVTIGSMALVFGLFDIKNMDSCSISHFYAAIVDNLPSPVTVWPGFLITASYTIYFPV